MSYTLHLYKRNEAGNWQDVYNLGAIGCLAGVRDCIRGAYSYALNRSIDTDQLTVGIAISGVTTELARYVQLAEQKLLGKGDVKYLPNQDASIYRTIQLPIDGSATMDDLHYWLSPYRLACERPSSVSVVLGMYTDEQLSKMSKPKFRRLWFAANLLTRSMQHPHLVMSAGYHQSNYSRVGLVSLTDNSPVKHTLLRGQALSGYGGDALINADSYYRRRKALASTAQPITLEEVPGYSVRNRVINNQQLDNQRRYYCVLQKLVDEALSSTPIDSNRVNKLLIKHAATLYDLHIDIFVKGKDMATSLSERGMLTEDNVVGYIRSNL